MKPLSTNLVGARKSIASFAGDLSRSYFFSINIPAVFSRPTTVDTMTVLCASTKVPDFTLKSKTIKVSTLDVNVVEGINFSSWKVTFLSDSMDIVRSNLLTWSSVAWDFNRKGATSPASYKRQVTVNQLNLTGNILSTYTLVGVYPEHVGGYELSNDSNEVVKFDVSFKYDYFTFNNTHMNGSAVKSPQPTKPPQDPIVFDRLGDTGGARTERGLA
jgi:hypothetical protein